MRYAVEPREGWVPCAWVVVDVRTGGVISHHGSQQSASETAQGMNAFLAARKAWVSDPQTGLRPYPEP